MYMSTNKKQMMEGVSNNEFQQYGSRLRPEKEDDELDQESLFSEKTWQSETCSTHFSHVQHKKSKCKTQIKSKS
ncbi:unnamed protein product [marine sediment metagenome]|uniref:Uncharacterized protein n=1 Tax=marine sediment metagenome TaxID=412755 RepID=X1V8F7_9ZZZZ